jgi:tetratricopeptide (TPR) repeat protein
LESSFRWKIAEMLESAKYRRLGFWKRALTVELFLLIVIFVFDLSVVNASAPLVKSYEVESQVYKLCLQSDSLLASGDYQQARDVLLPAVSNDPTSYSSSVHSTMAKACRGLRDYDGAVREAELALKFSPGRDDALYTIALAYNDMGQFGPAINYLNKIIVRSHDENFKGKAKELITSISVYRDLKDASACIEKGQDAEAKRLLERAAKHDPSKVSGQIHSNLAYVLRRSGNPERAIVEGEKALNFDPSIQSTIYTVGIAYQDVGRFDDAITWLRKYTAAETDESRRQKAEEFMQELIDDKAKLDPAANAKPDYLDQTRAKDEVHQWPKEQLPVKFYISPSKDTLGYRPIFRSFVLRALDTWFQASGKKISYVIVDDPKKADVKLKFVSDELPMQENNRSRQKAGLTMFDPDSKTLSARVRIRTVCGFDTSKLIEDGQCATVCMHEVGHALGLGHSTSASDVMYFGSSSKQPGLPCGRDRETFHRLYEDYPETTVSSTSKPSPSAVPIKYLPPPMFTAPKPVDVQKILPPAFLPPPIKTETEKLSPPLFVPPPKAQSVSNSSGSHGISAPTKTQGIAPAPPTFLPAPLKKRANSSSSSFSSSSSSSSSSPPMFVPPPK